MSNIARRAYQRKLAAKSAGHMDTQRRPLSSQYELMTAALYDMKQTLKNIQSVQAKVEKKRELLPQFDDYIAGVLEADSGAQDDVLMTCMVYRFDIGDLAGGLDIGEYALRHGLQTPDHYQRQTAPLIAEQVADESLAMLNSEEETDTAGLLRNAIRAEELTREADMHDQIRAKLHKAIGYAQRELENPEHALRWLRSALQLNDRAGVKKDIEQLERQVAKETGNG
ncbi:MAG: phage terminase small subunit [Pseudohongiellaceae bacterium]